MKFLILLTFLCAVCMAGRLERRDLGTVPDTTKYWKKQCQGSCTVDGTNVGIFKRWVGTFRPDCFGNNCQDNAQAIECRDAVLNRDDCNHDFWIFSGLGPWGNGGCGCMNPDCNFSDCSLTHNDGFLTYQADNPCTNHACPELSTCSHDGTTASCDCDTGYEMVGGSCEIPCATQLATAQAALPAATARIAELEAQLAAMTAEKDKFENRFNMVKNSEESRTIWWQAAEAAYP